LDICHLLIHTVGRATRAGCSSVQEKRAGQTDATCIHGKKHECTWRLGEGT
jgi:hypothetical protein